MSFDPLSPKGSREKILARIREALQISAPARHLEPHGHSRTVAGNLATAAHRAQDWLPAVPEDIEGRIALFEKISGELKTVFVRRKGVEEAGGYLREIALAEGWKRIATHRNAEIDPVLKASGLTPALFTDGGYNKFELEQCDVGITGCEALVAQTASILISCASSGGRVLSVLPPHHVVIATPHHITRDLKTAFDQVRLRHGGKFPRYLSFITGPSRTGDIERILVLGAHGPKKLTVLLVE
jgi:L-lactate dehydrogenase complex protein LldG